MSCLDDVTLEKVLLEATPPPPHLDACPACAGKLAQMREENADFRRFVFPRTVDAVVAGAQPRRWSWWWAPLPVAVAAALVAFVARPVEPPADYVGLKGDPLKLSVYTLDAAGAAQRLDDGAGVKATAVLRFQVAPTAPCYLWVLSVDASGQVSRLFPAQGEAPLVAQAMALPGGATLDGLPGPERLFAVCTPQPLPWAPLASAARASSAATVRALTRLELSGPGVQASVLLEKSP